MHLKCFHDAPDRGGDPTNSNNGTAPPSPVLGQRPSMSQPQLGTARDTNNNEPSDPGTSTRDVGGGAGLPPRAPSSAASAAAAAADMTGSVVGTSSSLSMPPPMPPLGAGAGTGASANGSSKPPSVASVSVRGNAEPCGAPFAEVDVEELLKDNAAVLAKYKQVHRQCRGLCYRD